MHHVFSQLAQDLVSSPKAAAAVASLTATTGAATKFDWIPSDIGNIASLIGAVSTLILITLHVRKHMLEVKLIKKQLEKY